MIFGRVRLIREIEQDRRLARDAWLHARNCQASMAVRVAGLQKDLEEARKGQDEIKIERDRLAAQLETLRKTYILSQIDRWAQCSPACPPEHLRLLILDSQAEQFAQRCTNDGGEKPCTLCRELCAERAAGLIIDRAGAVFDRDREQKAS